MDGILEKRRVKNHVFHAKERFYNLQISLSKLISITGSPLFSLSTQILAQRNFLYTMARSAGHFSLSTIPSRFGIALGAPFALSDTSKVVIFKITRVRLWRNVLGSFRKHFKTIQRLTNPGSRFCQNRFRNLIIST